MRGFGIRVGKGSKVFIVEGQVNHRTRRVTIGRADVLSPEVARKRALQILGEMSEGVDPEKRAKVGDARRGGISWRREWA